jgi:hypothetical protein
MMMNNAALKARQEVLKEEKDDVEVPEVNLQQ